MVLKGVVLEKVLAGCFLDFVYLDLAGAAPDVLVVKGATCPDCGQEVLQ